MALPKELHHMRNLGDIRRTIGFTDIYVNHKKCMVTIEHRGNMGNNIKSVEKNVNLCFGKGSFKRWEKLCKSMSESGSPDYYYERIMKF